MKRILPFLFEIFVDDNYHTAFLHVVIDIDTYQYRFAQRKLQVEEVNFP